MYALRKNFVSMDLGVEIIDHNPCCKMAEGTIATMIRYFVGNGGKLVKTDI
jgi:hypothetical protein